MSVVLFTTYGWYQKTIVNPIPIGVFAHPISIGG